MNNNKKMILLSNNIFESMKKEMPREWTFVDTEKIRKALVEKGCKPVCRRKAYTLLKEEITFIENDYKSDNKRDTKEHMLFEKNQNQIINVESSDKMDGKLTEVSKLRQITNLTTSENTRVEETGVNSLLCKQESDLTPTPSKRSQNNKSFLAPLDIQNPNSIVNDLQSFKAIQSNQLCLNIGLDTEFQNVNDDVRWLISLQMSIVVGTTLIRYFFLVDPAYNEVGKEGGCIPLKWCLADILNDLKKCYFHDFPFVRKEKIIYKDDKNKDENLKEKSKSKKKKFVNYKAMEDYTIPICLICHAGVADISVFRRDKYDVDLMKHVSNIQKGVMSIENFNLRAETDDSYNYYWLINLAIRDTLGLTPSDNKSLKALGDVINWPKKEFYISDNDLTNPERLSHIKEVVMSRMSVLALKDPIAFYEYAMNDADIVSLFCSELFRTNHRIPISLSSAAALSMKDSIYEYFRCITRGEYDRIFRGLELLDEGMVISNDEKIKCLRATRYVPIRDNPDAALIYLFFENAFTGGFNACFHVGWISKLTIDFDLKNAYATIMASILDIDFSKKVDDLPKDQELNLRAFEEFGPLTPMVAVGSFDFPDDCYCPCIPVFVDKEGLKIYPKHGENVYMTGPDMYLALQLGAKITIHRGFKAKVMMRNGQPSKCLGHAMSNLVKDRAVAKKKYPDKPLIEKCIKSMTCCCYGKIAQNVSPKRRYDSKLMEIVDSEPSAVTSPYHASYITAFVRCMLIACINQLHDLGYIVYSVTTDGFITDATEDVVLKLDGYGFTKVFQDGRYNLNHCTDDIPENHVWEAKHYNNELYNITTRGNVGTNDEGVLAHNSYTTGAQKGSHDDRDLFMIAVLEREGRIMCDSKKWTLFSDIVERNCGFKVSDTVKRLSMNFDYKRCPIVETAVNEPVHYESGNGEKIVDTIIAEFDTRAYEDIDEFRAYRKTMQNEDCVKVVADLERVKYKSTKKVNGYVGKNLTRKVLLSVLMGYRKGAIDIPALNGLKQSDIVDTVNSWGIEKINVSDWKNCGRKSYQKNMIPKEDQEVINMINKINSLNKGVHDQ